MCIRDSICCTIELDDKFCDVIVRRYIEQVGTDEKVSVLRDGKEYKFSEVAPHDEDVYKRQDPTAGSAMSQIMKEYRQQQKKRYADKNRRKIYVASRRSLIHI